MRPLWYIFTGTILLLAIVFAGLQFKFLPKGVFNAAQVLSVFVLNPADPGGGGGDNGGGGNNNNGGGSNSGGGGGGGGGGAVATPPTTTNTTPAKPGACAKKKGDLNCDSKVNLTDFSLLAYWYKRTLTAQAITLGVDLNGDGKVTLADFSILAYYWNK